MGKRKNSERQQRRKLRLAHSTPFAIGGRRVSEAEVRRILEARRRNPGPCRVCGSAADHLGVFAPEDSQRWGAPPGKVRFIWYGICSACLERCTPEEIESRLAQAGGWS